VSRKHLRREPQHVNRAEDWWFYETNRGIAVVVFNDQDIKQVHRVTIPWRRIRDALARKEQR